MKFKLILCIMGLFVVNAFKSQPFTPYYPGMPSCFNNTLCPWFVCNYASGTDGVFSLIPNKTEYCVNEPITFNYTGTYCASDMISFGDCGGTSNFLIWQYYTSSNPMQTMTWVHSYNLPGQYTIAAVADGHCYWMGCVIAHTVVNVVECEPETGPNCLTSFAPEEGTYLLSYWVKEDRAASFYQTNKTYVSGVDLTLNSTTTSHYANATSNAHNKIIDGWQKVDAVVTIPSGITSIDIKLTNNAGSGIDTYFDDIRFHPFNSGFKSYVYDPVTLRLSAELDDRNYATFYEYDEEGKLIRVKKETEKGIKTVKETRTSISK